MPLRWGIVSCGLISADFVTALSIAPTLNKVAAIAGSTFDKAAKFKLDNNLDDAMVYGDYETLMKADNIDVVYIGIINTKHYELTLSALNNGKNVLVEKPMGMNAKQVRHMVETARKNAKFLMEGMWTRFFPAYRTLAHSLPKIGQVNFLQTQFGSHIDKTSIERIVSKETGGGMALDVGCYVLQLAVMVFGREKPEKIIAQGWNFDGNDTDDTSCILLQYSGKRMAQLNISGTVNLDHGAAIYGNNGTIRLINDMHSPTDIEVKGEKHHYPLPESRKDLHFNFNDSKGLLYEIQCVRKCIIDGEKECSIMPLDDSIAIAEINDEIRKQLGIVYDCDLN